METGRRGIQWAVGQGGAHKDGKPGEKKLVVKGDGFLYNKVLTRNDGRKMWPET